MTREEMAQMLELEASDPTSAAESELKAAAAELRKVCGNCRYKSSSRRLITGPKEAQYSATDHRCVLWNEWVPIDGSGFCHRWESQPAGKAQD